MPPKRGDLGARIAQLRAMRDWTQAELARRLEVDPSYIPRIEQGERLPSIVLMTRMASVFGISLSDFFSDIPISDKGSHPRVAREIEELDGSGVELISQALEVASKHWTEEDWRRFQKALRSMRDTRHSEGGHSRWRQERSK